MECRDVNMYVTVEGNIRMEREVVKECDSGDWSTVDMMGGRVAGGGDRTKIQKTNEQCCQTGEPEG